jgi:hypothetical protein
MNENTRLNCERSEMNTPLVALRYGGNAVWICPQCLPTLIHEPAELAGKLSSANRISPAFRRRKK